MKPKCCLCKKIIVNLHPEFCDNCVKEIQSAFHYSVGGTQITPSHYKAIIKRGYVIPEELDKDRK